MTGDTIVLAGAALRAGERTALDLVEASLAAIEQRNAATNAFIRVDAESARAASRAADRERALGVDRGPLHGIPISLKDLIDVQGQPTTAASRVLRDRIADADATIVDRLRMAGAVFIGKTNLHEFALGTTSEDTAYGPVRHPSDPGRSSGGSSGGSAVAVATGMGLASIGSDTGGSIRIPAAACGIVGLKPSIDDVPTAGVIPLSATLDHVGPLARSVQDAAWLWQILADRPIETIKPSVPKTLTLVRLGGYFAVATPEVRQAFDQAIARLTAHGVTMRVDEIADADRIMPAYVNVVLPEAATWHARYLVERPTDYTPPVRSRLESGREIPAVDYLAALQFRRALIAEVDRALDGADALVLPTLPIVAPPIGAGEVAIGPDDPPMPVRAAMLRNTQLFNMTGHPAISIPLSTAGLPVGLQIVGRLHDTARLLAIAASCEKMLR